jgi:phosphoglycolate phosphatase
VARVEAGGVIFEVDAVAFDKDGTLIDLDAAWGPAARAWVETAGQGDNALIEDLAHELGLDLTTGRLVVGGIFAVGTVGQLHQTTLAVLAGRGVDENRAHRLADAAETTSAMAGEAGNLIPLGDVAGLFRALTEAGAQVAIVSSDDRAVVEATAATLEVEALLTTVVAGDDGLNPKPAPDALRRAASQIGVDPGRMLYVGDSWVDAAAGVAAGAAGTVLVGDPPPEARRIATVSVPSIDAIRVVR